MRHQAGLEDLALVLCIHTHISLSEAHRQPLSRLITQLNQLKRLNKPRR